MKEAAVDEIFSSIQGEGPWLGRRHIFVRFSGCDIRCRYCDTPAAVQVRNDGFCRVQKSIDSFERERVPSNLSAEQLSAFCSRLTVPGPSRQIISITGGEPLLQHLFLSEWLLSVRGRFSVYLETNGIHDRAMKALAPLVDTVSMDFKLPSATGLQPYWEEHRRFLEAAAGRSIFVKAVVTSDTSPEDIVTSAGIIAAYDASLTFVLQPASGTLAPDGSLLLKFQNAALGIIEDVRIIPQTHTILKVP